MMIIECQDQALISLKMQCLNMDLNKSLAMDLVQDWLKILMGKMIVI